MIVGSFVLYVPLSQFSDRQGTTILLVFDMEQSNNRRELVQKK